MNKLPFYSYYDYYENYWDVYAEYYYWPKYYGIFNISNDTWCHYSNPNTTHVLNFTTTETPNATRYNNTVYTTTNTPFNTSYDINVTFFNCTPHFNGTFPPSHLAYDQWWFKDIRTVMLFMYPVIILCTILSFIIIILYFRKLSKANRRTKPDKLTTALTTVSLLSYLLYNITEIVECVGFWIAFHKMLYIVSMCVWNFFWAVSKTMMYALYAYRYYALRTSAIASPLSKRRKVCIFATIVIIIWCQFLLALLHGVYGYLYETTEWNDPQLPHIERVYLYSAWIVMGIDFIVLFSFGYLVIYHILKVAIAMEPATDAIARDYDRISSQSSRTEPSYNSNLSAASQSKSNSNWLRVNKKSSADCTSPQKKQPRRHKRRNAKQMRLIEVSARVAVTSLFAMLSSMLIQLIWLLTISYAPHLMWISYWWSVDSVINMLCIYLSMGFAKAHYGKICDDCCKCHPCFMQCIMKYVDKKTQKRIDKQAGEANIELEPLPSEINEASAVPQHVKQISVSVSVDPPSDINKHQILICVDCFETKAGRIYDEDGEFYCYECWSHYY